MGQAKAVTEPVLTDAQALVDELRSQLRGVALVPINLGRILPLAVKVSVGIEHIHNRMLLISTATRGVEGIRTIDKRCHDAGFSVREFDLGPNEAA
jgi:hypothetical protein